MSDRCKHRHIYPLWRSWMHVDRCRDCGALRAYNGRWGVIGKLGYRLDATSIVDVATGVTIWPEPWEA